MKFSKEEKNALINALNLAILEEESSIDAYSNCHDAEAEKEKTGSAANIKRFEALKKRFKYSKKFYR